MSRSNGRGRKSIVLSFMIAFATVALFGVAPVSAGNGPLTTFEFEINNNCVRGEHAPAGAGIKVTLRGPDGAFQGSDTGDIDGGGQWGYLCFWGDINAGDRLIAKVGSSTRTFVVPPLNFTINRVTDVVSGKTAPNSEITFYLWGCQDSWNCDYEGDRTRVTNNKGKFTSDFTSMYDLRGNDEVEVDLYTSQGDIVYRELDVPSMNVGNAYSEVYGETKPNSDVTVWLFNSQGTQIAKARDHSNWWDGEYYTKFRRDILPGMFVGSDIAGDALWKVFDMKPQFNVVADTVSFKCWKNRLFYFYAANIDGGDWVETEGLTDSNGNVTINTMTFDSYDLRSDDTVEIECRNPMGDDQDFIFEVP